MICWIGFSKVWNTIEAKKNIQIKPENRIEWVSCSIFVNNVKKVVENQYRKKSLRLFLEETIQKKRVTLKQIWRQKSMITRAQLIIILEAQSITAINLKHESKRELWSKNHHHPAQFLQSFVKLSKNIMNKISSIWCFSIWLPLFRWRNITTKHIFIVHTSKPYPVLVTNLVCIKCSVKYPSRERISFYITSNFYPNLALTASNSPTVLTSILNIDRTFLSPSQTNKNTLIHHISLTKSHLKGDWSRRSVATFPTHEFAT